MPDNDDGQRGPTSMTMEEIEASQAKPAELNPNELKLDGESVPESLRGKTLADVIEQQERLSKALKISEESRQQLQALTKTISERQAPPDPTPTPAPKEMTREELNDLYSEDPIKAIEVIQEQAARKYAEAFERRLGPIAEGAASTLEQSVKQKYAREFELLGDEIKSAVDRVGGRKVMNTPDAWDDLISWVRGRPGNFEKLTQESPSTARQREVEAAGLNMRSTIRSPVPTPNGKLDDVQKQIAAEMGMSDDEYLKWSKV